MASASAEPVVSQVKYQSVYDQSTPEIYDSWASDGYDENVAQFSLAVESLRQCFVKYVGVDASDTRTVLDAGCGTGRVAEVILRNGKAEQFVFDGVDFSTGMLEVAKKKGSYRHLKEADLKKPLSMLEDSAYDAIVSSGVFLQGHCGPECLPNLARVLKPGGHMLFTVRPTFYEETKDEWLKTFTESKMSVLNVEWLPYARDKHNVPSSGDDGADAVAEPFLAPIVIAVKQR
jgi:predicted TPR repeat methyltransferase